MGKKGPKASADKKKNKGPKGKKARAKAKLERQWGEEAVDTGREFRKGRYSRLLPSKNDRSAASKRRKEEEAPVTTDHVNGTDHPESSNKHKHEGDSSDDSDKEPQDETMDLTGGAYAKLLKTIRSIKSNGALTRNGDDDEDDTGLDDDMEDNLDQDENDKTQQEILSCSDEEDHHHDNAANINGSTKEIFDPFGTRFTKNAEPLPEDEHKREDILRTWQETKSIPLPHVDPMLEIQVSTHLLEDMQVDAANATKEFWKKIANSSFGCNRESLMRSWQENNGNRNLSRLQRVLYPFMTRYADCLVTGKSSEASQLAILHIANHVLTSRGRIQRLNRKIKAQAEEDNKDTDADKETSNRDQGFTRPTVLVMLPTRGTCHSFVKKLLNLVGGNVPQEYLDRFDAEYGAVRTDDEAESDEAAARRRKRVLEEKGAAWLELFGDNVNDDDDFKIGIALNAKAVDRSKKDKQSKEDGGNSKVHVKLYTDFYSSDIIVCSPLGLKMAMSSDTGEGDTDILSSIEICMLDRSDVLMMQNWDHVNSVLAHVNQLPQNNNETDFSRVRNYFLVNQAAYWRQIILFTDVVDPTILSTFKRFAKSKAGSVKTRQRVLEDEATIAKVIVPVQQVFQRVPVQSLTTLSEDRMNYLTQKILPPILQHRQKHTLIYIASYFDFVVLRNYLIKKEFDFVSITEYSRVTETSRGRARFLQGRKPLMLYTGRSHFFLRHKIKGVRHLVFFGLPEHPEFYCDLVNVINEGLESDAENASDDASNGSISLFTRYDAHALERIVGTKQANRMVKGDKPTFLFAS